MQLRLTGTASRAPGTYRLQRCEEVRHGGSNNCSTGGQSKYPAFRVQVGGASRPALIHTAENHKALNIAEAEDERFAVPTNISYGIFMKIK
jgi:hypothetical protein